MNERKKDDTEKKAKNRQMTEKKESRLLWTGRKKSRRLGEKGRKAKTRHLDNEKCPETKLDTCIKEQKLKHKSIFFKKKR